MMRICALLLASAAAQTPSDAPFHIHLALSSDPTKMFVSWRTNSSASPTAIRWGASAGALTQSSAATYWLYTDSAPSGSTTGPRDYHFYRGTLSGLAPGARVFYTVGASAVASFVATRSREQFNASAPLRIAVLGDLGYTDGQALAYLLQDAAAGTFDHFTHVGDYACS